MTPSRSFAAILSALLLLCGPGCKEKAARDGGGSPGGEKKLSVCLLPKSKGIDYFTSCARGAAEAATELGVELTYDGPSDGAADKAANMIEKWTLKGVDVIAVSPNDPSVLAPAMKKARQKGVRVITWDADGQAGTRDIFVNQATAEQIGFALVDTMANDIGGAGEVAIITADLTAANQNEWMKHMRARLAEKWPRIALVSVQPSGENQNLAFQAAQSLMNAYPQLKGIFGISSVAFPGAAEAVRQAGKSGKVLVTGLSTPNVMRPYVLDGTVRSVVLWNTVDLGYLTIHVADAVARGRLRPGDTVFMAGRLGEKQVVDDNVLLGGILVFTKDNIGQFDF